MVVRIRGKIGCVSWFDELGGSSAPEDLRAWAANQASRADAWKQCPRPDWQLWLAAHAPDLTPRDQRMILGRALELEDFAPDRWFWWTGWMIPVPTKIDVVDAFAHARGSTLGFVQKLKAGIAAFMAALVIGVVIDRLWLGDYEGFSRTMMQTVVFTPTYFLLVPVMRAIRRRHIKRGLDGLTFARAFEMVWPHTVRVTKVFSAKEQPKRAHGVRIDLIDLGKRAFSYDVLADSS
jgi:hypothetical protein